MDFSHLDNLDASHHPTLSEKIRSVVRSHYGKGWGWSPPKSSYQGHSGGGDSYSHSAGGGGGESDGHHHLSSISSHSVSLQKLCQLFVVDTLNSDSL